ncbi:MAG: undecaprenyl-diphosphate phosphatase [Elusimicrobiales bacterium]
MSAFHAFFLGAVQGIGEFLPISSSAHLRLYSYIFNLHYQGIFFDVMLHLGTILAVFIYFRKDIIDIIKNLLKGDKKAQGFVFALFIATLPGVFAGFFLNDYAETLLREVYIIGAALIFFSVIIYLVDRLYGDKGIDKDFNWKDGIVAGIFQSIAIIPGASRSAMSICGLLLCGYSRHNAARISFFMSMPIILGAGVFEFKKVGLFCPGIDLIVGFLSSFIIGLASIKFLLSFLKKHNLNLFVVYRIILGVWVITSWFYEK